MIKQNEIYIFLSYAFLVPRIGTTSPAIDWHANRYQAKRNETVPLTCFADPGYHVPLSNSSKMAFIILKGEKGLAMVLNSNVKLPIGA